MFLIFKPPWVRRFASFSDVYEIVFLIVFGGLLIVLLIVLPSALNVVLNDFLQIVLSTALNDFFDVVSYAPNALGSCDAY